MGFYVSQEGARNLKTFKFSGVDNSYVYKYVLTPMNNYLLQFVPLWMAPNLITFIGLWFILSACILTYQHSTNFDEVLPSWLYAWCGFSLFAYQTIDNLDGKQARRTGTSSPLGLLFDHGIDAVNTVTGALVMASVLQLGVTWRLFALVFWVSFTPFMWATWEEFWTGTMALPVINGPTDGVLLSVLMCFYASYHPGFWSQKVSSFPFLVNIFQSLFPALLSEPVAMIPIGFAGLVVFPTIVIHVTNAVSFRRSLSPILNVLPFYIHWILATLWYIYSPSRIFEHFPRTFLLAHGFLFCNLICKMMLAHLCDTEYKSFRWALIPFIAVVLIALAPVYANTGVLITEVHLLHIFFAWGAFSFLHFVYYVIEEMTEILHISCFTIPKEKQEATMRRLKGL